MISVGSGFAMKIKISEIPEGKTFEDYPEDTEFVLDENFPRYILEPFRIVFPKDKEYDSALTREEIMKISQKPSE